MKFANLDINDEVIKHIKKQYPHLSDSEACALIYVSELKKESFDCDVVDRGFRSVMATQFVYYLSVSGKDVHNFGVEHKVYITTGSTNWIMDSHRGHIDKEG